MRFGIGAKLGVLASVLILATGGILFAFLWHWSSNALQQQAHTRLANETLLHAEELSVSLNGLREITARLSARPEIQEWLRTTDAVQRNIQKGRIDRVFEKSVKDTHGLIQVEFLPSGESAREAIRASHSGYRIRSGLVEEHFPELRRLTDPAARLGRVRQTTEVQANDRPVPVCRAAAPVLLLAPDGTPRNVGAVVVTMDFRALARFLSRDVRLLSFLTDRDGRVLLHPDSERSFAFEKDEAAPRILEEIPDLTPLYEKRGSAGLSNLNGPYGQLRGKRISLDVKQRRWEAPGPYYLLYLRVKEPARWAIDDDARDRVSTALEMMRSNSQERLAVSALEAKEPYIVLRGQDRDRVRSEGDALAKQFSHLLESPTLRECRTYSVEAVRLDLGPDYSLGLIQALSHEDIEAGVADLEGREILWVKLGILAGGVLVAFLLARRLTRPLQRITEATHELARGNFDVDLPVNKQDEIGVLARCFKDMAEQLQQNIQQKREDEARLKTVLRTAAEGIFILDDEGQIQLLNAAAQRIFGYSDRELEGKSVKVLIPREVQGLPVPGRAETPSAIESIKIGRINNSTHEVIGRRKDGSTFPLELSVSDVSVGDRRVFTGIVRDITERKKAEKEIYDLNTHLRRLNEQLDRRVQDRTRQLSQANAELSAARDQALEASRVKSIFLAQMSHEFRTPLNHIKGYAEMLREELQERNLGELVPDLDKVLVSCRNLLYLIGDVLDLSSIDARQVELTLSSFVLSELIDELATALGPRLESNHNRLEVHGPDPSLLMYADRERVRQVLWNLLTNATKFTRDGLVTLRAEIFVRGGREWVRFEVRDTGIGLSAEQIEKLFRPFSQVDSGTTRKYDGTGLGLVISRSFCRMMGGEVEVASTSGQGSTFTVLLPAQVSDVPPTHDGDGRRVPALLLVDDESTRDLLREVLRQLGYDGVMASNGLEGLRLARRMKPGLVVVDAQLRGDNGWDLLASLKSDPLTAPVPVLMLTQDNDRGLALALGAADNLTRPLEAAGLARVIARLQGGEATLATQYAVPSRSNEE